VEDWDTYPEIKFDENNKWWQKIRELTEAAVQDSHGDYIVGITDLHTGTDGLVSLRGPERLCMDIFDNPRQVKKRINEIFKVYKTMYEKLDKIISLHQEGTSTWMGVWHPEKRWYPISSDFSCLICKDDFEEFVIPGIMDEIDYFDESIYHLDGPGALHHLDRILKIEKLSGVQWVYGEGQPTARYWIDVLKKIQDAGKLIQIHCVAGDIKPLCEALRPEGLNIVCYTGSKDEADAILRLAEIHG